MNEIEFDKALSDFLDALFALIRSAFAAGWRAAMDSDLKTVLDGASK